MVGITVRALADLQHYKCAFHLAVLEWKRASGHIVCDLLLFVRGHKDSASSRDSDTFNMAFVWRKNSNSHMLLFELWRLSQARLFKPRAKQCR